MMNKFTILIFVFFLSTISFGQIQEESEFKGKWIVEKIIEKPTDSKFLPLIEGFKNATFIFNENKNFQITTTKNSELFKMMTSEVLAGSKWKFVAEEQLIKIGNQKDQFSSMMIFVKKINEQMFFHIHESGLTFLMKRKE